jgi:hypothetical protein
MGIELIFIGIIAALFSKMLLFGLGDPHECDCLDGKPIVNSGALFGFYGLWIAQRYCQNNSKLFWIKPLGLCKYCFSFWVALGVAYAFNVEMEYSPFVAAVSHFVIDRWV